MTEREDDAPETEANEPEFDVHQHNHRHRRDEALAEMERKHIEAGSPPDTLPPEPE